MAMDDIAADEVRGWLDLINGRGMSAIYAAETPDQKRIVERSTMGDWVDAMRTTFDVQVTALTQMDPGNDPPDFRATIQGRDLAVELTESVDGDLLAEFKAHLRDGGRRDAFFAAHLERFMWTPQKLAERLARDLDRKERKYARNGFVADLLVICCAEELLSPQDVAAWLPEIEIPARDHLRSAHFIMDYDPVRQGYPVFRLYGDL